MLPIIIKVLLYVFLIGQNLQIALDIPELFDYAVNGVTLPAAAFTCYVVSPVTKLPEVLQ